MNCENVAMDLQSYLDRELAPEAAARVESHLAACEDCRRKAEVLKAASAAASLRPASKLAPDFTARLRRRIEEERPPREAPREWLGLLLGPRPVWRLAAAGGLACFLVAGALLSRRLPAPAPGPAPAGLDYSGERLRGASGVGMDRCLVANCGA